MKNNNHTFNIGDFVMLHRKHRDDPFAYGTIFGATRDCFGRIMFHVEWNDTPKSSIEYSDNLIWVA